MTDRIDMSGSRYGRWLVISYAGKAKWNCVCDCGTPRAVNGSSLRRGISSGCEHCSPGRSHRRTHGFADKRLYRCWEAMKYRCTNPNATAYERYGGRGITVCDDWMRGFEAFKDWALANGYSDELTIERSNNDAGYSPSNCYWATHAQQNRNTSRNRPLVVDGHRVIAADLAAAAGLPMDIVRQRIHRYGWSIEKAISTPVMPRVRHEPWRAFGMSRSTYQRRLKSGALSFEVIQANVDQVLRDRAE